MGTEVLGTVDVRQAVNVLPARFGVLLVRDEKTPFGDGGSSVVDE